VSQTYVNRVRPPATHGRRLPAFLIIGVVLLFAVIGVISAGIWASNQISGGPSNTNTPNHNGQASLAQAHASATAIVAAARRSAHGITSRELRQAHKRSGTIIGAAERKARNIVRKANHQVVSAPTTSPALAAPTPTPIIPTPTAVAYTTPVTGATSTTPANLSGVPASWLVVAYNVTFGSGPGSVGGVTVTNRSQHTFSGTVVIQYSGPKGALGSSTASFSGLGAGQTEVVGLSGAAYPSGATGYKILVENVH